MLTHWFISLYAHYLHANLLKHTEFLPYLTVQYFMIVRGFYLYLLKGLVLYSLAYTSIYIFKTIWKSKAYFLLANSTYCCPEHQHFCIISHHLKMTLDLRNSIHSDLYYLSSLTLLTHWVWLDNVLAQKMHSGSWGQDEVISPQSKG